MRRRFKIFCFSVCVVATLPGVFSQNKKLIDSLEQVVQHSAKDTSVLPSLFQLNNLYRSFNPDSALAKCRLAMQISEHAGFKKGIAKVYLCLSILSRYKGENAEAISYQLRSLEYFEEIGDKPNMAKVYGNMGITHWQQGNLEQALKFYQKALDIDLQINNKHGISAGYNNIGGIYSQQKNNQKALEYFLKTIKIDEELGDEFGLSDTYGNIGNCYFEMGMYDEAVKYQLKSIGLCEKVGNKNAMSTAYINTGAAYAKEKKYGQALDNYKKGMEVAKEINYKETIKTAYKLYAETYNEMGDHKNAFEYFRRYSDLHDSLITEASGKQVAEMQTKYQSEKKEKENKLLQKENELSAKTIRQQKITSYFIIGGLMLTMIFAVFILRGYRQKQRANIIITRQKEEVLLQKEIIEEKNKEILDSIHYAKRIQTALLASERYIERNLNRLKIKNDG
ncbi:MAG TPA: tetratricopeptide repeat protein [Bacteroidia bacterium]|jgi:tetratricopeptide (TPR) repeat protein|nr:tetratricopeptide repeat protein [Bacteroidia bacterium]